MPRLERMEGFRAKRTPRHMIEPIGYGLLRKTVNRGAAVNSAVDQFNIHCIASEFRSKWLHILPPHSHDSPRSYILQEHVDCEPFSGKIISELTSYYDDLDEDYTAFKRHMMKEGYFVRGFTILTQSTTFLQPPLYVIDFSLFGCIQESLVRFPDKPWSYDLLQAELLYGAS